MAEELSPPEPPLPEPVELLDGVLLGLVDDGVLVDDEPESAFLPPEEL